MALDEELAARSPSRRSGPQADDPDRRARFVLEAEITGGLEHPGIVPVYSLGTTPTAGRTTPCGSSGATASSRPSTPSTRRRPRRRPGAAVELRELLGRFVDVCDAIAYAHSRGVLHRDLKPDNIMLGRYGETLVVDWGLAKAIGRREAGGAAARRAGPARPASGRPTLRSVLGTPAT